MEPLATTLFKAWKGVPCVMDIMHVAGYLWSAANVLFGERSKEGTRWLQAKLAENLRGRVGYVIGGLRQILTNQRLRKSVRETLANGITFFHNHQGRLRPACPALMSSSMTVLTSRSLSMP